MNMKKYQEALSYADKLKEEIKVRLKCEVVDFEIVEYDSGKIGVHWDAIYKKDASYVDIPYRWTIASIRWNERLISMYADPTDFLVFNSISIRNEYI